jgi:hypothetical protein
LPCSQGAREILVIAANGERMNGRRQLRPASPQIIDERPPPARLMLEVGVACRMCDEQPVLHHEGMELIGRCVFGDGVAEALQRFQFVLVQAALGEHEHGQRAQRLHLEHRRHHFGI